ncbi:MAG: UvrD-helicase domain-containing protein [Oscillospiraceae bacterium]|nr:UvrD-helicase domain-containing protein [Oscillospiraceae bacterium]
MTDTAPTDIMKGLNARQQEAVAATRGPVLVLAGAGSGKTTVLVHRVAQILATEPVPPWKILAITFTNKAAGEMKERLKAMLGPQGEEIWAGTFHATCAKFLRRQDGGIEGFNSRFAIYDADDSKAQMKRVMKALNIDDKYLPISKVLKDISAAKEKMLSPSDLAHSAGDDPVLAKIALCYKLYQMELKRANAMDFDDLLYYTVQMLEGNPDILNYYQRRFDYILVDEYQDTNHTQYRLVSLLAAGHRNLCVVGDDDQSIYRFRGATIENILSFEHQFPGAKVVRLEENYRSTQNILDTANRVIAKNTQRKGKTLFTSNGKGEPVIWQEFLDEREESRFIAESVRSAVANGGRASAHAVLYRSNALSNAIETAFRNAHVPYRIIGGMRFYDRKEIKDALAYLTIIANPSDEVRLRRIINEPKRGIGEGTLQKAADAAARAGVPLFEVISRASHAASLQRVAGKLEAFGHLINGLRDLAGPLLDSPEDPPRELSPGQKRITLQTLLEETLERSGYWEFLELDKETCEDRRENLMELGTNLVQYEEENDNPTLIGFLEEVSLLTDIDRADPTADAAYLMTIHASKGLEFDSVYLPAWEEGVFPNRYCETLEDEEEERRLAYVGITRARRRLFLTTCSMRMLWGQSQFNKPSRFLRETGLTVLKRKGSGRYTNERYDFTGRIDDIPDYLSPAEAGAVLRTQVQPIRKEQTFTLGDTVRHGKFGIGTVTSAQAMPGGDTLLEIAFESAGTRRLLAKAAKLEKQ